MKEQGEDGCAQGEVRTGPENRIGQQSLIRDSRLAVQVHGNWKEKSNVLQQ